MTEVVNCEHCQRPMLADLDWCRHCGTHQGKTKPDYTMVHYKALCHSCGDDMEPGESAFRLHGELLCSPQCAGEWAATRSIPE